MSIRIYFDVSVATPTTTTAFANEAPPAIIISVHLGDELTVLEMYRRKYGL